MESRTIHDVYDFLKSYNGTIKAYIDGEPDESSSGCLQETIFTLFASLRLFPQLSNYTPCTGNFGLKTIKELKSIEEIFENKIRAVGDGACDFTAINRESKSILGTTSKYKRKFQLKNWILMDSYLDSLDDTLSITKNRFASSSQVVMTL